MKKKALVKLLVTLVVFLAWHKSIISVDIILLKDYIDTIVWGVCLTLFSFLVPK